MYQKTIFFLSLILRRLLILKERGHFISWISFHNFPLLFRLSCPLVDGQTGTWTYGIRFSTCLHYTDTFLLAAIIVLYFLFFYSLKTGSSLLILRRLLFLKGMKKFVSTSFHHFLLLSGLSFPFLPFPVLPVLWWMGGRMHGWTECDFIYKENQLNKQKYAFFNKSLDPSSAWWFLGPGGISRGTEWDEAPFLGARVRWSSPPSGSSWNIPHIYPFSGPHMNPWLFNTRNALPINWSCI